MKGIISDSGEGVRFKHTRQAKVIKNPWRVHQFRGVEELSVGQLNQLRQLNGDTQSEEGDNRSDITNHTDRSDTDPVGESSRRYNTNDTTDIEDTYL